MDTTLPALSALITATVSEATHTWPGFRLLALENTLLALEDLATNAAYRRDPQVARALREARAAAGADSILVTLVDMTSQLVVDTPSEGCLTLASVLDDLATLVGDERSIESFAV